MKRSSSAKPGIGSFSMIVLLAFGKSALTSTPCS